MIELIINITFHCQIFITFIWLKFSNNTPISLLEGGGGGGAGYGGGGGAGGMKEGSCALVSGMSYVITVGAGGSATTGTGNRGGDSSVGTLAVAIGGGGGRVEEAMGIIPQTYGGSGGGADRWPFGRAGDRGG